MLIGRAGDDTSDTGGTNADTFLDASDLIATFSQGTDGDDNGYEQLAAGFYDVDGVQDLDYEVELTFQALDRLWAGERPPKILIDPGFVITRDTLNEKRDHNGHEVNWTLRSLLAAGLLSVCAVASAMMSEL